MAKGRELKGRIKSVENTRKITRTMEMVATSKMKRAQDRVVAARPYANSLTEVIANLYTPELAERFPLLRQPAEVKKAAVIVLTSNRGLAGAFNANLLKEARALLARLKETSVEPELHVIGKKGLGYFRYVGRVVASSRIDVTDRPTAQNAAEIVDASEGGLMVHDADHAEPSAAFALSRLTWSTVGAVPLGVFRDVKRPVYDEAMGEQLVAAVGARGEGDLERLLHSGDTWQID